MKKVARVFQIDSTTNIKKVSMSELLEMIETKRSLTHFLIKKTIDLFEKHNMKYVVAGNGERYLF